ncbi:MAG: DUF6475 domain-containing protein [Gammaproteobacteria bacterium]
MHDSQAMAFSELMTGVAAICKQDLPKTVLELYWRALKRFDFADIERALQTHISDPDVGQFLPKPADIIRRLEGSGEDKAQRAWTKVMQAIEHVGSYESVVFDDARIHVVLADMGGWIALCGRQVEQLKFLQHEFQKRYRHSLTQTPSNYPKILGGVISRDNASKGFDTPAPVFIGDESKARQVMQTGGGRRLAIHRPEKAQNNVVNIQRKNFVPQQVNDE